MMLCSSTASVLHVSNVHMNDPHYCDFSVEVSVDDSFWHKIKKVDLSSVIAI